MTHAVSTNTAGSWAVAFATPAGSPINLSGYIIEAAILTDLNGADVPVADGGLTTSVGGTGNGTLTWTLADGHGLSPGVYYVQTRYHTGDGNLRDLSKDTIAIAAKGGVGEHINLFAFNGAVATTPVIALVAGYSVIDGGAADSSYSGSIIDGGTA